MFTALAVLPPRGIPLSLPGLRLRARAEARAALAVPSVPGDRAVAAFGGSALRSAQQPLWAVATDRACAGAWHGRYSVAASSFSWEALYQRRRSELGPPRGAPAVLVVRHWPAGSWQASRRPFSLLALAAVLASSWHGTKCLCLKVSNKCVWLCLGAFVARGKMLRSEKIVTQL